MISLSDTFLAAAGEPVRALASSQPDLEARLGDLLRRARGTWSSFTVETTEFIAYLAEHAASHPTDPFRGIDVEDLYLAAGCAKGDPAAVAAFEAVILPEVKFALRLRSIPDDVLHDVVQDFRNKVLVGHDGHPPRIRDYAGRGALKTWSQVAAIRVALNTMKRERKYIATEPSLFAAITASEQDSELAHLTRMYREDFKQGFQEALGTLSPQERNVLRLHYLDGKTLEAIAEMQSVHRVTMVRRFGRIRALLAERTRAVMARRFGGALEAESILRLIASEIDLSLHRLLGAE